MKFIATLKDQPKAFPVLFFVEMWERFGYYATQSLLVIYMVKKFSMSDAQADETFAAFAALVYATPVIGGYLGDRFIGYHRTLILGAISLALGYTIVSIPSTQTFAYGLACVIIGNGFFKAAPNSLLGKVYGPTDKRLEGGFTLYYMSINIGSGLSISLAGFITKYFGFSAGFSISAIGLIIGLITFWATRGVLQDVGSPPDFKPINKFVMSVIILVSLLAVIVFNFLLQHLMITHWVVAIASLTVLLSFIPIYIKIEPHERNNFLVSLILIAISIAFFALYFQSASSINLFVLRNVDRHLFGITIPTTSFQSLNPIWIIILAPCLAILYNKLKQRRCDPSIPLKFSLGIIIMGLGFLCLDYSRYFANAQAQISSAWIVLSYFLYSLAELLVSALGVAMIAKLVPHRFIGYMMGVWFFSSAAAATIAGYLAALANIPKSQQLDPFVSLMIYAHTFGYFGWGSVAVGLITLIFAPKLSRLMGEKLF